MIQPIDIIKFLPHRYPFLLIDRVIDYKIFDYLIAIKNITINEPFFVGHFPNYPIMPGVLMIEALAQAGGILSNLSRSPQEGNKFLYFFAGIKNAKFKYSVIPGDQLRLEIKVIKQKNIFWKTYGKIIVNNNVVCSADLISAVKEIRDDR